MPLNSALMLSCHTATPWEGFPASASSLPSCPALPALGCSWQRCGWVTAAPCPHPAPLGAGTRHVPGWLRARPEQDEAMTARGTAAGIGAGRGAGSTLGSAGVGCPRGGCESGLGGSPGSAERAFQQSWRWCHPHWLPQVGTSRSPRNGRRRCGFGRGQRRRQQRGARLSPAWSCRQRAGSAAPGPAAAGETAVSDSKHRRRAKRQSGL